MTADEITRETRAPLNAEELLRRYGAAQRVFHEAGLAAADLPGATLSGVDLSNADLRAADLSRSNLAGASLQGARLDGANFDEAILAGTDLRSADLSAAKGLTLRQLDAAVVDAQTRLPNDLVNIKNAKSLTRANGGKR